MGKDVLDITEMEESHSRDLFDMWLKWQIMLKDDSKVSHSSAEVKLMASREIKLLGITFLSCSGTKIVISVLLEFKSFISLRQTCSFRNVLM